MVVVCWNGCVWYFGGKWCWYEFYLWDYFVLLLFDYISDLFIFLIIVLFIVGFGFIMKLLLGYLVDLVSVICDSDYVGCWIMELEFGKESCKFGNFFVFDFFGDRLLFFLDVFGYMVGYICVFVWVILILFVLLVGDMIYYFGELRLFFYFFLFDVILFFYFVY